MPASIEKFIKASCLSVSDPISGPIWKHIGPDIHIHIGSNIVPDILSDIVYVVYVFNQEVLVPDPSKDK